MGDQHEQHTDHERRERARRARAKLDAVFGDPLPETTSDERDDQADRRTDADYLADRPPHHGG